jgi:hypothetical protein
MRDTSLLISAEDLLEIFSKVTEEYRKRIKLKAKKRGKGSPKISQAELLAIFKKCSKNIK